MKRFNKILSSCILFALCGGLTACGREELSPLQRTDIAMGTVISQSIYIEERKPDGSRPEKSDGSRPEKSEGSGPEKSDGSRPEKPEGKPEKSDGELLERYGETSGEGSDGADTTDVTEAVMLLTDRLEKETLSWRLESSEIYRLNQEAGGDGTVVSEPLYAMLERLQEVSELSNGALDITIGDVVRLWDIDEYASGEKTDFSLPGHDAIAEALKRTGFQRIAMENGRIYLPEGMKLDLGAVGKGAALDRIAEYLASRPQVTGAVISLGGSILTYGEKPDASVWRVAVVDPLNPSQSIGYLALEGKWCVSTSGDYERYVELEGKRYHHIIDPSTGYPARSGVRSVTVLGSEGLMSDALSTACFVLGVQEGTTLAEAFGAEVLFVDEEGRITMSEGMKQYFHGN